MSSPSDSAPLDAIFDLLSNQRRRYALMCLSEHQSLTLADLAEQVTSREQETSILEIPEEDVLRVYMSLWHAHIPKLAEADVVVYDQERDLVHLGPNAEFVERVIARSDGDDDVSNR